MTRTEPFRQLVEPGRCSAEDCHRERKYLNGLCNLHYARLKRTGSVRLGGQRSPIPNADASPILANIETLARERDWSFREVCRKAGIDANQIYRMRYTDPRLDTLRAFGAAFNVEYWRLLIPGEFTPKSEN